MDSEDVLEALEEHLRFQSEPELLLLKGHLILEQCLNQLLRTYVTDEAALERMNLSFSRKLDLLVTLGHRLYVSGVNGEALIREINRIRNKLAHQLNFGDLEIELQRWACTVTGFTPKTINRRSTYLNTVRRAFTFTAAFMSGVAIARQAIREARPNPSIERTSPGKPVATSHVKR